MFLERSIPTSRRQFLRGNEVVYVHNYALNVDLSDRPSREPTQPSNLHRISEGQESYCTSPEPSVDGHHENIRSSLEIESANQYNDYYEGTFTEQFTKLSVNDKTFDDVQSDLSNTIAELTNFEDFSSVACAKNIHVISQLCSISNDGKIHGQKLAPELVKMNYLELTQKMWRKHFNAEFLETKEQDALWYNMSATRTVVRNMSDKSKRFCKRVIKIDLHTDIVQYLSSEHLKPGCSQNKPHLEIVQGFIGSLYNIVQRVPRARETLRECNAIEILQPYREFEHPMYFIQAITVQSCLITEEENEQINSDMCTYETLNVLLETAIEEIPRFSMKLEVGDVLQAINSLAKNDMNAERIAQAGILNYYVQLLRTSRPKEEQLLAVRGLRRLGFKCIEDIKMVSGSVEGKCWKTMDTYYYCYYYYYYY